MGRHARKCISLFSHPETSATPLSRMGKLLASLFRKITSLNGSQKRAKPLFRSCFPADCFSRSLRLGSLASSFLTNRTHRRAGFWISLEMCMIGLRLDRFFGRKLAIASPGKNCGNPDLPGVPETSARYTRRREVRLLRKCLPRRKWNSAAVLGQRLDKFAARRDRDDEIVLRSDPVSQLR